MWKTSRRSRETGLLSGFDGIRSVMCRHHRRQPVNPSIVAITEAYRWASESRITMASRTGSSGASWPVSMRLARSSATMLDGLKNRG